MADAQKQFLKVLKDEHDKVKDTIEQIQKRIKDGDRNQGEVFNRLRLDLLAHMEGEEKGLYSMLKGYGEAKKDVLESYEEHRLAKMELEELTRIPMTDVAWNAKLQVLSDLIHHHIEEEEDNLFDDAKDSLDDSQFQNAMRKFQEEKEKVMTKTR